MISVHPTPHTSFGYQMDRGDGHTEVCCDGSQNLPRFTSGADRLDFLDREFVPGSSGREVAHVLTMIPEVQVSKVDASKVAVIAGVQNVEVAGVVVVNHPHGAGSGDVATVDAHGPASIGTKGGLAFVGDCLRGFAENVNERFAVQRFGRSRVSESFSSLVMHGAVAVSAVLTFASLDLARFHTTKFSTS